MSDQHNNNPLLQRVQLPGETFKLPSCGIFYKNNELDDCVKDAEVHVHPMTAIDEITIKTPDMLFSGDAVRQVFARCIPSITNSDDLLAKDVDYLLVCLRKVSYGNELIVPYKHDCDNASEHKYTIDISQFIRNSKRIDPTVVKTSFSVKLPNEQTVDLQPIRFKDFVTIMQANSDQSNKTVEQQRDELIQSVCNVILRVDEIEDKQMIQEWLTSVPPMYIRKITEKIDETLDWGPDFNVSFTCKDCGEQIKTTLPLNPLSFFI